jgi:hypothetical protein
MERTQALARNHLLAVESLAVFVGLPNFTHVVIIFFMHVQEINFFFLANCLFDFMRFEVDVRFFFANYYYYCLSHD